MTQRQVVRNATVFDSERGALVPNQQIIIRGQRIEQVTGEPLAEPASFEAFIVRATM